MEKRKGSILIFVLFVFIIIFMIALYIQHSSTLQMQIARNNSINNQAFYLAEEKIFKVIYEDKYFKTQIIPKLKDNLRGVTSVNSTFNVIIKPEDLEKGDREKTVFTKVDKINNRKCISVKADYALSNQIISMKSFYTIFTDLFDSGMPVLHKDYINPENIAELNNIISNIHTMNYPSVINYVDFINTNSEKLVVTRIEPNNSLKIDFYRNDCFIKTEKYNTQLKDEVNEYILVLSDKYNKGTSLTIDSPNKLVKMRGVIYLEGDLIINSEFNFDGILIINNGKVIVNSAIKPSINGIILSNGEAGWINLEDISVTYNDFYIYRYGTYLPNVMEHKLLVTKKVK